ncbi:uncharacterized protein LOC108734108 [Agrilus planipennis]|uniref:Sucrose-6-phosphate hydrolase n=1 Tax=Agrilus planipennis TaxID=224129 RepID=A0A1W4WAG6_AGRPL|nr:uncharacterized protein LOC108734108 [Agrilus planipennis]
MSLVTFKVNKPFSIIILVIIFNLFETVSCISVTNERYRLNYHIMSPAGWINDPNGFSYYNGEYHVFYQYNPDDATHANMHWGHVTSEDLVHWKHLPIALYQDQPYDVDGVYSGSGIVVNESLVLMYTGNVNQIDGRDFSTQSQALAISSDGESFIKYINNPVIPFPPQNGGNDFRDPKIWKYNDTLYVVLGNQNNLTMQGRAVIYSSYDLFDWTYVGVLAESTGSFGYMWECPDFFELNGFHILLLSPQGIEANGDDYQNIYQTGYFVGSYNYRTNNFSHSNTFIELDHGHDFYAAQTMETPDGRRIMIAWMDMWERDYPEQEDGWVGALTIPRELTLSSSGRILQNPVQELIALRTSTLLNTTLNVEGISKLFDVHSAEILIKATFNDAITQVGIRIELGNNSCVLAYLDTSNNKFVLDRGDNDPRRTLINVTNANNPEALEMRVFLDKSSIEIFLGDGEITFSSRIYPSSTPAVYALSNGTVTQMEVVAYELENIWSGSWCIRQSSFVQAFYFAAYLMAKLYIQ